MILRTYFFIYTLLSASLSPTIKLIPAGILIEQELCNYIRSKAKGYKIRLKVNDLSSMFSIFFTNEDVTESKISIRQDSDLFKRFYHGMLKEGIYFSPSGYETNFLSSVHTDEDIEKTLEAIDRALKQVSKRM